MYGDSTCPACFSEGRRFDYRCPVCGYGILLGGDTDSSLSNGRLAPKEYAQELREQPVHAKYRSQLQSVMVDIDAASGQQAVTIKSSSKDGDGSTIPDSDVISVDNPRKTVLYNTVGGEQQSHPEARQFHKWWERQFNKWWETPDRGPQHRDSPAIQLENVPNMQGEDSNISSSGMIFQCSTCQEEFLRWRDFRKHYITHDERTSSKSVSAYPIAHVRMGQISDGERQVPLSSVMFQSMNDKEDNTLLRLHISGNVHQRQHFEDDDDTISVLSFAESITSVFTSNSASSSATGMSSVNGYSLEDIATASKMLSSIFHEDEGMSTLYKIALANAAIGPERLQRNLRRIFKAFSEHLKVEATDQLEYMAARLVAVKSRGLAESIVEKFRSGTMESQTIGRGEFSDSSEEERDSRPVNEETLADLIAFRRFLIESQAFETLQAQLRAFVLPKLPKPDPEYSHNDKTTHIPYGSISLHVKPSSREDSTSRTWQLWRRDAAETAYAYLCNTDGLPRTTLLLHLMVDLVFLATDGTLVNTGLLEPPLCPTKVRLRWSSMNGDEICSDVEELEQGGVAELVDRMERTSGVKVTASSYRQYAGGQQYPMPRPDRWIRKGFSKVASALTNVWKPSPCLPQHAASSIPATGTTSAQTPSQHQILHLVACMHRDPVRKFVQQDRIEDLRTDRELLDFMRRGYVRQRKAFLRILSLKCVKGIYFVKLWLPVGGIVIVRHYGHCSDPCDCIPPPAKVEPSATAEYRFSPIVPKTRPPIPPEYLAEHFCNPSNAGEGDFCILNQVPKRTCGPLQGVLGDPAEGWGIYYDEVWDKDLITLALFIILAISTLLFGVLWAKYKFDVQGAFGISAWMASLGGMLLFVLVPRLEKIG